MPTDVMDLWINARQRLFLSLLARGYDVKGIVRETHYSGGYVYAQLRDARGALAASTLTAAIVEAIRWGVIDIPGKEEMVRE